MFVILQSLPSAAVATCVDALLTGKWLADGKWRINLLFSFLLHMQTFGFALVN